MDLQDVVINDSRAGSLESLTHPAERLHPHHTAAYPARNSRSPSLRSPSPRQQRYDHRGSNYHDGLGFSDTVNNVVEIQRNTHQPPSQYMYKRRLRGPWSASTSPARSPSPVHRLNHTDQHHRYGTTSLEQRSRSPSPMTLCRGMGGSGLGPGGHHHYQQQLYQHSYPVLVTRRTGHGRRLPPTPNKPSTLQLKAPVNINFPKLSSSPTHGPMAVQAAQAAGLVVQHGACGQGSRLGHSANGPAYRGPLRPVAYAGTGPLTFEQAVLLGRGGRLLPSTVPNGFKPQVRLGLHHPGDETDHQVNEDEFPAHARVLCSRHSDSDDDDWC